MLDEEEILCPCSGTRVRQIRRYVERGIVDVTAISEGTGALSGCGGCEFDVLEALDILKAEVGEQNAKTAAGTTPAPVAQESPTPSGMDE